MQAVVDEFPTMPGPRQAMVNALRSLGLIEQRLEGGARRLWLRSAGPPRRPTG